MPEIENRRPLKVREAMFAQQFARWLSDKNIAPNQISVASVVFAALAAVCLLSMHDNSASLTWAWPLLAALFIQCRLLCNLFDGMVAVECGKSTASGDLFNDVPDRIADPLILISAGYAVSVVPFADALGWSAGLGAVMTAYVRTLAAAIGAPVDFRGPMAKQHRMAIITLACIVTSFESLLWERGWALTIALTIIIVGCIFTVIRRVRAAYTALEQAPTTPELRED